MMSRRENHNLAGAVRPSLFGSVRWPKARQPSRAIALAMIENTVKWADLETLCRPHYQADQRKRGRKGYSLAMMMRCRVVQEVWELSDEATENAILDSYALALFVGTDPWEPRPPSASALRAFRTCLDDAEVLDRFGVIVEQSFLLQGLEFRPGYIREPIFRRQTLGGVSG
ncbi:MAG: transposase [Azonexus sp.]|nr:transposase [Azonexus sp.]